MKKNGKPIHKSRIWNVLMAAASLAICICIAVFTAVPETFDISVGEISPQTITAPMDIVDKTATQRIIDEEVAKIGPVYKNDSEISQQVVKKINEDFAGFEKVRADAEEIYNEDQAEKVEQSKRQIEEIQQNNAASDRKTPVPQAYASVPFNPETAPWEELLSEDDIARLKEILPKYISTTQLYAVISLTAEQLSELQTVISDAANEALQFGISNNDLDEVKSSLAEDVAAQPNVTEEMAGLAASLIANDIVANEVYDEDATQAERDKAAANVTPVEYKEGQNIVVKGEIVKEDNYEVLRSLGILASESTSVKPYIAVILYLVLCYVLYAVFLGIFNKKLLQNVKKIAILSILTAAAYASTAAAQVLALHFIPIFLFVILGSVLLSPKNAIVYSVFLSLVLMSITTGGQVMFGAVSLYLLLSTLMGSFFAVYSLKDMRYRSRLVVAGLCAAIPGAVLTIIVWLLQIPFLDNTPQNIEQTVYGILMIAASGVMCGIVSIGILPLIENAFKLTTPSKLLELADPMHPLNKRLMTEAPGTYHHSILVANLAEAACDAVGGFSLLARVGAYYHDIGKVENPLYFKENQRNNRNPHDALTEKESAEIIRKHVTRGVSLLKKSKMPKEIIDIANNHHGSGTVGYFYYKALEKDPDADIADFSYDGKPPETKEQAIVMLADIVEAAVRSLDNPSREEIEGMVQKLIKARYDEGQLDRAPLNRTDLNRIADAFMNIFDGIYSHRIKYPEIKIHGDDDEDNVL